jgi:hypothetical protein
VELWGLGCRFAVVKALFVFKITYSNKGVLSMPNWCENELYIRGTKEDLDRFKTAAAGENGCLDMNSFIPYPIQFRNQDRICDLWIDEAIREAELNGEEFTDEQKFDFGFRFRFRSKDTPSDGFNSGGCEWCCENWGTKWNFCDPTLDEEEDDSLYYEFETAWSPPIPIIKKMGRMFPELRFELRYFEAGMGFNGILVIEDGEVAVENCARYYGHRGG